MTLLVFMMRANEREGIWLESSPRQDLCENAFSFTHSLAAGCFTLRSIHLESIMRVKMRTREASTRSGKVNDGHVQADTSYRRDYRRAECVDEFIMQRGILHTQPIVQKHEKVCRIVSILPLPTQTHTHSVHIQAREVSSYHHITWSKNIEPGVSKANKNTATRHRKCFSSRTPSSFVETVRHCSLKVLRVEFFFRVHRKSIKRPDNCYRLAGMVARLKSDPSPLC